MRLSTNQKSREEGIESEFCEDVTQGHVTAHLKALVCFLPHKYYLLDMVFGQCCLLTCAGVFAEECWLAQAKLYQGVN